MITQDNTIATGRLITIISQIGTALPTLNNIINTLGTVTMTRLAAGQYLINATNQLTVGKTTINGRIDGTRPILMSIAALNDFYAQVLPLGVNNIALDIKNAAGTRVDLSTLPATLLIEINVYNKIQTL